MKRASVSIFCFLFVAVMAAASTVQAGGFALYEWSNRSIGMATTGYTKGVDASVVALNPSLMTDLEGAEVYGGFAIITPSTKVVAGGTETKTKKRSYVVPHAYYTQQLSDDLWFGAGMYTRFGLGTHYPQGWTGSTGSPSLQYVDLQSTSFTPTVAYKVNDDFSVAIGLEVLKGGISIENQAAGSKYTAKTEGYAVGGNLSMSYDFTDSIAAGFIYRAPMRMSTNGKADLVAAARYNRHQKITATLPSSYTLGLSWNPIENWMIEFDTMYTRWEITDKMHYEGALNYDNVLDYKNSWRFQLGTEYWATEWLALRAGYIYDVTPTISHEASYMLPVNDRQLFSGGLGFKSGNWNIDWSLMYVVSKERSGLTIGSNRVSFEDGNTLVTGVSVGYDF